MEIRINKLTIDNFKGIRHFEFTPGGESVEVLGENGTGKSTLFDAFIWLLFGKDHRGQSASGTSGFDIKPIDPATREVIHHATTSVEAALILDGYPKTIRRTWREEWVKPRGQAEAVLTGHTASFWVDGVELPTKKEYDAVVAAWVDERIFKAITDPMYLIGGQTAWKDLRGMLLDIVGGDIDRTALRAEFADLLAEAAGEPMEFFRKRIAAGKKKCRQTLDAAEPKIQGMMQTRPAAEDFAALRKEAAIIEDGIKAECRPLQDRMEQIDRQLEGGKAAAEEVEERLSQLYSRQLDVRNRQEKMLTDAKADDLRKNNDRMIKIQQTQFALGQARDALSRYDAAADIDGKKRRIATLKEEMHGKSQRVFVLRDRYSEEREKAMDIKVDTRCHACGQELPAESIEEARAQARAIAVEERKRILGGIVDEANALKAAIAAAKEEVERLTAAIEASAAARTAKEQAVESARAAADAAQAVEPADPAATEEKCRKSPEFLALRREEQEIGSAILDARAKQGDGGEKARLLTERKQLENQVRGIIESGYSRLSDLKARIAREDEIKRIDAAIEKERSDVRAAADELARLERLEFRTEEYVRADVGAVEDVVNNRFRVTRFRMFDQTQEGGLIETCYATDAKGVPFRSMNDAQRILCGLDVIRVISEHYGVTAPIFVDNAESVTTRDFGTKAQIIALTVTEGAHELTIKEQ